jgi:hypothetical protein
MADAIPFPQQPQLTEVEKLQQELFNTQRALLQARILGAIDAKTASELQLQRVEADQTAFVDAIKRRHSEQVDAKPLPNVAGLVGEAT